MTVVEIGIFIAIALLAFADYLLFRLFLILRPDYEVTKDDPSKSNFLDGRGIDLEFLSRSHRRKPSRAVSPISRARKWIDNKSTASKEVI